MDHTQAHGKYEAPEITALVQAGCDVTIGSSQKHAIMHHKFAVVDGVHVLAGSWNFSLTASKENNFLQIVSNLDMAALFLAKWQEMHDYMQIHEPQWQLTKGASA
jgi:phosphatidylserine/phosphatidylglycerophosphate/cardiolipin synthase-like enzyme